MTTTDRDAIARRMIEAQGAAGLDTSDVLPADPWQPRWGMDSRWVYFECGCVAERMRTLVKPRPFDPIVFRDLPEQAVYESVCQRHGPGMNKYVHFGGYADFVQWKKDRRAVLMGRTRP